MKLFTIIVPVVLLLAGIAFIVTSVCARNSISEEYTEEDSCITRYRHKTPKWAKTLLPFSIVLTSIMALILMFIPGSIHQVEAGQVAVVKVWGDAKEVREAGMHFDSWISHKYEIYDTKTQEIKINSVCYSNDGQTMDIELVVQYQIQPENAMMIAKNYGGLGMLESKISTVSLEKTKSVLSQKSAMKIIETRAEVSPNVEQSIRDAITTEYYVNINTVVLTDISFTDEFEETVEQKMIAEQDKKKAEYEKEKAIIKAEEQLEVAKLEANARIAKAQAEAESIEAMAKAEANAIKLKSIEAARMLGFTITETAAGDEIIYDIDFTGKTPEQIKAISDYLKYIEYLETWNGTLPTYITDTGATLVLPTI